MINKKLSVLAILHILQKYTDADHPMFYADIVDALEKEYGLKLENKAIGRNIQDLREFGYDIETGRMGTYLVSRDFDDSELKLLIDNVLANRYITATNSKQLIDKLMNLSNDRLKRHSEYVDGIDAYNKSQNKELFYNIEIIDEAIARKKQISFVYNSYDVNHKLVPRHNGERFKVSPYRMVVKNQRYYLMCKDSKNQWLAYFKIDKITDISLEKESVEDINSIDSFTHGINDSIISNALPYMFSDVPQDVVVEVHDDYAVDAMCDWFGRSVNFMKKKDGVILAQVKVSPLAMKYWALQYADSITVVSPGSLKKDIIFELNAALERYSK